MREPTDRGRIGRLMEAFGRAAQSDVREMLAGGLVDPGRALDYFARIEPELYRFPAIDPPAFRAAALEMFGA